jgi:hypothetical protein
LLYYSYCELTDDLTSYDTNTSSAIIKHINRKHSHIVIEKNISKNQQIIYHQLRQFYRQAVANKNIKEFDLKILNATINENVFIKALISLIVVRNFSFCIIK